MASLLLHNFMYPLFGLTCGANLEPQSQAAAVGQGAAGLLGSLGWAGPFPSGQSLTNAQTKK